MVGELETWEREILTWVSQVKQLVKHGPWKPKIMKIEGESWWNLYILQYEYNMAAYLHILFMWFNQTICCELFVSSCPLQGGSFMLIFFLNCTRTLEDGTKGSPNVAKLKTWVLSHTGSHFSSWKLQVLSDWAWTCEAFPQELLSNVYQNLENFRSDRRQLLLDVDTRDKGNRKRQGASTSPIIAWKFESGISDIAKISIMSFQLNLGNLFSTEPGGKGWHLGQQIQPYISRVGSDLPKTTLI